MKNFNLKLISLISIQLFVSYSVMAATCKQTVPDSALVKKGTLVMSTNPTLPPLQFVDSTGKLKGMRITLGKEVAKRLCLKPEYIRIEFSAMIPGLQAERWDMINTGIFWNSKRAAMMNMIPYESAAISISVKKGNPLGISKQEDLAGKAVGVEIGGLEEKKLKEIDKNLRAKGLTPINIRVFD
ncbi:MAG TPA: transporter substrate-binding domain-containing protein, partial [Candidatus Lambdaproteobacteria bacterium]|nr:transporter substrate-binding domain-containing protein [Candidatus Lambdaproteobacteria bacterium]